MDLLSLFWLVYLANLCCRPVWEGGQYDGDEKKRLDVLRLAMELGADYIDVELKVCFIELQLYTACILLFFFFLIIVTQT